MHQQVGIVAVKRINSQQVVNFTGPASISLCVSTFVLAGREFSVQSMETKHCVDEDTRTSVCRDRLIYRIKMHHLAEVVNKHNNTIIIVSVFEGTEDEVHGNGLPTLCRDRQRLQWST